MSCNLSICSREVNEDGVVTYEWRSVVERDRCARGLHGITLRPLD